ncbi:pentapeptide repeat-containing protein [Natrinema salifodinae]|uniref:Pentapeptide repeat-containing protein n=1 Tax=Natrinema salifodinae TaxID=1202768 RepID=A0A1I0PG25_9EURY|nr:pentapeptide repeat-containing protein [Natrinema salifodinae]SEW12601.1 Pentapeptide repeat-containing protein [Natrinema salifodinae]
MTTATDRCGYVTSSSGVDDAGAVCCWRPTWRETDRCIWHTETVVPEPAYERNAPASDERLDGANFQDAALSGSSFLADHSLVEADFTNAVLDDADLSRTDLRRATFRDVDAHGTSFRSANLHDAVFVFADLRGADFRNARLYRAGLTDVRLNLETEFGTRTVYEDEIATSSSDGDFTARADSVQWVYRELQRLYDENAFPERVHTYYLREMHFRRRHAWLTRDYLQAIKLAGSRWIMHYGTSPWRVVATSLLLIFVCAGLYPLTGGIREVGTDTAITYEIDNPTATPIPVLAQTFLKSLYFSVITFATLGYGDIQPVEGWARAIAGAETLLGSLLMALLVFVLTQSVRH